MAVLFDMQMGGGGRIGRLRSGGEGCSSRSGFSSAHTVMDAEIVDTQLTVFVPLCSLVGFCFYFSRIYAHMLAPVHTFFCVFILRVSNA